MGDAAVSVERLDVTFPAGDGFCAAWLYLPKITGPVPAVVMGHGLGATRELRLDAYARRFAEAGIAALAFTYRSFGDSAGHPRQVLSVRRQLEDWEAALSYVKGRTRIDAQRIGLWGTSFGGGHAITVARRHPDLAAAIAQCPFTDGLASSRVQGVRAAFAMLPLVVADMLARLRRRPPVTVPVVAAPGTPALMNTPDSEPGYRALVPSDCTFVNEVAARAVLDITRYRPGRHCSRVQTPILFCVSTTDSVAPPSTTLKYARRAPKGQIVEHSAGHFDFYVGEAFDSLVDVQTEFLRRHLVHTPTPDARDRQRPRTPADFALAAALSALGSIMADGSRVHPSLRSQITRSLTFELTAGRNVARHWVFDGPRRRATTGAGHAESPDCAIHFATSGQALRALASPRAVERITADYQRGRVRIDGSPLIVMWFYGLTRIFVRIGRNAGPTRPVPHPYLAHDPSTTGAETIHIEPAVTRLDPTWTAAWNARSRLWMMRAATDEPMPEP